MKSTIRGNSKGFQLLELLYEDEDYELIHLKEEEKVGEDEKKEKKRRRREGKRKREQLRMRGRD